MSTDGSRLASGGDDKEVRVWDLTKRTCLYVRKNAPCKCLAFTPDGRQIAGNLQQLPIGLPVDGRAHEVLLTSPAEAGLAPQPIIAVARTVADGRILVFARSIRVVTTLEGIVARALLLGAIPAIGLVIAAGIWLSRQAQWRVKAVNQSIDRIMQGHVQERLPVQNTADDFDQLADARASAACARAALSARRRSLRSIVSRVAASKSCSASCQSSARSGKVRSGSSESAK